jgi:hypothetical protein
VQQGDVHGRSHRVGAFVGGVAAEQEEVGSALFQRPGPPVRSRATASQSPERMARSMGSKSTLYIRTLAECSPPKRSLVISLSRR